jgi:hypothetical protein
LIEYFKQSFNISSKAVDLYSSLEKNLQTSLRFADFTFDQVGVQIKGNFTNAI